MSLGGHGDGAAVLGPQEVVGREHQQTGLCLGLGGQGDVDGHLVAVEVGVEGSTHQGMELDGRPSTSTGSKAWMPRRWRVGARLSITGCSLMMKSRASQTSARPRSTIFLADLMLLARPSSTSFS